MSFDLNYAEWQTLLAIADAMFPQVPEDALLRSVPTYTLSPAYRDILIKFAKEKPSDCALFQEVMKQHVLHQTRDKFPQLQSVLKMMSQSYKSVIFTGYFRPFCRLSESQQQAALVSLETSRLSVFRSLHKAFYSLILAGYLGSSGLVHKAMRHPLREPLIDDMQRYKSKDFFLYSMLSETDLSELTQFDAIIIGSGSGAGVVASRLSRDGFSVLVIEKGKYYAQSELSFSELEAVNNLYECGGMLHSEDKQIGIIAGSTFGGGSTVNWSASIPTPSYVRREWAIKHGVEFYNQAIYTDAIEYVCDAMGVSSAHIKHSMANKILINGSKKLGSPVSVVKQNTGGHEHRCGYCGSGCRFGEKQGCVCCWFVDAAKHGAKFIDRTTVEKVLTRGDKAVGVMITINGKHMKLRSKTVILSAGALNSPLVLRKSGFTNSNIGKHLKIHPVIFAYAGLFDSDSNSFQDAILTAVNTEKENLDGKGYGARIECSYHQPIHIFDPFPWHSGLSAKQTLVKYNNLCTFITMCRDKGEGSVSVNPIDGGPSIEYKLSESDRHSLVEGYKTLLDILLVSDVDTIYTSSRRLPAFHPSADTLKTGVADNEFREWKEKVCKTILTTSYDVKIYSAHQMSTCRMGSSPRTSVARASGELWELGNIFIADASALPSASGVNPMITVMATAHVIAGNVSENLKKVSKL
ncbi:GMC oxidoreductase-domain-containing protein [Dipodascopsis uninucleata]